jgi:DnaJ-class molecular chaperone
MTCPSCDGTGIVEDPQHGHALRCERCGGTGEVEK